MNATRRGNCRPIGISGVEYNSNNKYYTVVEFAKILGVHPKTICRWILEGKLSYWQLGNSRTIRIPESELISHLRGAANQNTGQFLEMTPEGVYD